MIGFKGIFAIISVISYTFLIVTFFKLRPTKECQPSSPCIRFCSSDRGKISDEELFQKFSKNDLFDNIISSGQNEMKAFYNNYSSMMNYKILRGEPKCDGGYYSISSKYFVLVCLIKISRESHYKNNLIQNIGYSRDQQVFYSFQNYCYQEGSSDDEWLVKLCLKTNFPQNSFHIGCETLIN